MEVKLNRIQNDQIKKNKFQIKQVTDNYKLYHILIK